MTERDADMHQALEQLLTAERTRPEAPSSGLMARILADAQTQQLAQHSAAPPIAPRHFFILRMLRDLGGWPALAGLAAGAVAGIWIGINPPAALLDTEFLSGLVLEDADYLVDLAPDTLMAFDEGAAL